MPLFGRDDFDHGLILSWSPTAASAAGVPAFFRWSASCDSGMGIRSWGETPMQKNPPSL